MESFLDEIYGPMVDYFEDDYHLAAAKLLEVCFQSYIDKVQLNTKGHKCGCLVETFLSHPQFPSDIMT